MNGQVEQLEIAVQLIEGALQLLHDPSDMYLRMSPDGRRKVNEDDGVITEVVLQSPLGDLMKAQEIAEIQPIYERRASWPSLDWDFTQVGSEDFSEAWVDIHTPYRRPTQCLVWHAFS